MRALFLIFGLLVAYTFIYAGISHFWPSVTARYKGLYRSHYTIIKRPGNG